MTVEMMWYPNSCVRLRTDAATVVIDPGIKPKEAEGLGKADIVLLTHHHGDHINREAVKAISRKETKIFGPEKCRSKIDGKLEIVRPGDSKELPGAKFSTVFAYNNRRVLRPTFHRRGECVGYVVEIDRKRIYHAGDTSLIDEMKGLGKIDVAFLPIGGTFTMGLDEAVEAAKIIKPGVAIPIHMLRSDPAQFVKRVQEAGLQGTVLSPGQSLQLE